MNNYISPQINHKYRPDIDGLRALAVLSVLGFHAFPEYIPGGFIGVDLFFVISGFLISSILLLDLNKHNFSLRHFLARRMKRIFPGLILILTFCSILGWFALFPVEYKQLGKHIASGAGFISNIVLWEETGYFANAAETKPLLHLWSLGIEEQFYLLWPVFLAAMWKKKFNFTFITSLCVLGSFILNVILIHYKPVAAFYFPLTRFWELLAGSLLAYLFLRRSLNSYSQTINNLCSLLGVLLITYGIVYLSKESPFPGVLALIPVLGALLIILAGKDASLNRMLFSNRIMIWFGLISFPLYLWHWPLLSFATIMEGGTPSNWLKFLILLISVFLAWCTYHFIEKPVRFGAKASALKIALLIVFMLTICAFGIYLKLNDGISARFKNEDALSALINAPLDIKPTFTNCAELLPIFKSFTFDAGCVLLKKKLPDLMFIGDSHMGHYTEAIAKQFQDNRPLIIAQTSCLPFSTASLLKDNDCKKKYEAVLSFLETNKSVKKVYLSAYWAYLMSGGFAEHGLHWRHARDVEEKAQQSFLKNGREFLSRVLKTNKEIIFLKDIPDLDFNINSCFVKRPLALPFSNNAKRKKCWIELASFKKRSCQYEDVLKRLLAEFREIKIYDPKQIFCRKKHCYARDKKFPYYINGDHLNNYAANIVIRDLKRVQSTSKLQTS